MPSNNNDQPVDQSRQRTTALGPRHESHGAGRNGYSYGARTETSAFPQLNSNAFLSRNGGRTSYTELHAKVFEDYCTNTVLGSDDISDSQEYWLLTPEQANISYLDTPDIGMLGGDPLIVDASPGLPGKTSYAISFPYGPSVQVPDLFTIYNGEPNEDSGLSEFFDGSVVDEVFVAGETQQETPDGSPYIGGYWPAFLTFKAFVFGIETRMNPRNFSNFAQNRAQVSNRQLGVSRATRTQNNNPGD